ncbi:vitamin K epoxide reductase family protein [Janibacter terrae]|uniref:Vitamin K epoxide reductase family protein n=1 Tax=Janibacter terrae TaxID=103817 RepID=A0ABZ2FFI0_9MICO
MSAASSSPIALRRVGWLYVVTGLVGLVAAVALLVEKMAVLKDPEHVPACSINPILSCGSVMSTPQAEAFGIPNPIIGVMGFAVLAMLGVVLASGSTIRPWLLWAAQVAVTLAAIFIHWLVYQSLYVIGALCPYCMAVWVVTIAAFWHTSVHTMSRFGRGAATRALVEYRGAILTAWYLVILGLIAQRFWTYWSTLA